MADDWEHIAPEPLAARASEVRPAAAPASTSASTPAPEELSAFFAERGLGKYAEKLIEITDAESVEDLKLIDAGMADSIAEAAGLKFVSAQKLRNALAELRGESGPAGSVEAIPSSPSAPSAPSGPLAAAAVGVENAMASPVARVPDECVAICVDRSGSMRSPFSTERTRMDGVKQMFYAFRDRTETLGAGAHRLGLVQFDIQIERMLELTERLDQFEAVVDEMQPRGQTAIFSAIAEAVRMLEPVFAANPATDLRILALTDGQNNAGIPPNEALRAVNNIGAVVDAIIVGDKPDIDLRRIVTATGGECYQISNLGEGFELLESESVVSLRARRGGAEKPPFQAKESVEFSSIAEKSLTHSKGVQKAPALAPSLAAKRVVDVASIQVSADSASSQGISGAVLKRIMKELRDLSQGNEAVWLHSGAGVHIFPAPDNLLFWRALIEGPEGSPFEGGVFSLAVTLPNNYPFKPPQIKFTTPIYHCNVNDSGSLCLDILKDSWSPALTVPKCLEAVRQMMRDPNPDDALRQWIAELTLAHIASKGRDSRYFDTARQETLKEASRSLADWRKEWGC
mmetsp:Transcript_9135/g.20139  ORF Transcript_9135/g.20139 Transcript_9135/m.20139 type:complete len:571 (+) Transcript_9135:62-1774(+)|eukprot:CAMPEP_0170604006 /NCGR_PEP_ID=MMETSP0224-20130122/19201_1 /TAXON_ID=285029 /ORGANISM="Togula jolla, Strain CCCM 725" /LENGTH=570 /DNA_ID=CAMNT_0010928897 /DNA_START=58 /DNA_END=1770 /DNA_ORIENTATION=-